MANLTIAALSTPETISAAALAACKEAATLYVLTAQTPCILPLEALSYQSMDDLYEAAEDFDALNEAIAVRLITCLETGDAVFAAPGRGPGEALIGLIKSRATQAGHAVTLLPGLGYGDAAPWPVAAGQARVTAMANALPERLSPYLPLMVEEIDSRIRAGEVKLALSEYWPDDFPVYWAVMGADGKYAVSQFPLFELDQQNAYHATSALLVPAASFSELTRHGYEGLELVMHRLRAPGGCPWDREQTHESLKKTIIEECYEVLDAIDREDDGAICEELGDVLLQVAFHAEIAAEQARFTGRDVATGIVQKLVYRHPHIFADGDASSAGEVLVKWEQLKKAEKQFASQSEVLKAVPKNLPALMRSYKIQKKAAQVGFDWESAADALPKLQEEVEELKDAMEGRGDVLEEFGDLLFAAVNVGRLWGLEPEEALGKSCEKFVRRFAKMEDLSIAGGNKLEDMTLLEQNNLWNLIKNAENRAK